MNNLYLDTNLFLYLSESSSPYHQECLKLIKYCQKNKIALVTSTETIQEIIHFTKNTKQLEKGLKVAQKTLQLVSELLPINQTTIEIYLKKTSIYKTSSSRDLIHLAVCLENKIDSVITFDKDFERFGEIKAIKPKDITD